MANAVELSSAGLRASASFTPAANSHNAGDCVGAAAEFALDGPRGGEIMLTSATFLIADATVKATAWRLHLYSITPPSALADDAAWDIPSGDRASYLGYVDLGTAIDVGASQFVEVTGINKQVTLTGTSLFGYLVNLSTITPAAATHTVTLRAIRV